MNRCFWATASATDDATADATDAATYDATADATASATDDATADATDAATYDATYNATYNATADATADAERNEVNPAHGAARACQSIAGIAGRLCARRWHVPYQGGNMWAGWACFLGPARDVLRLRLPEHKVFKFYETAAAEGGFRVTHEEFCMVSDFPKTILMDPENRPHCDDGPSHEWRDGWKLWHIHGVRIPFEKRHIVEHPETITCAEIDAEENAEIRRVMIDRFGA